MNSKQNIRTLRQRCQNLFLTVTKAKTWKYKFNVEIGRKLWNAFIFRYISGTPRRCWPISDLISLQFGSSLRDVITGFSIKGLVFEQDKLKQHRWEHQISAPVRLERLRARWKIVHAKTNRRTNFQKQAVVASTRKLSLKTRGHVFGNRQMIPLKVSSADLDQNSTSFFGLIFLVLVLQKIIKKSHLGWSRSYTCSRRKISNISRETKLSTRVHFQPSI